ncbi:c-type cytochrome [Akkermansiaceae bacterium]|nr:c-type cytochrome [Akkermansiaceae bacterium]
MRPFLLITAIQLLCISASAAETFPAANGLERSLVAREPLLKNPVSVSLDVDGTIYVTETQRRKIADLDIREYMQQGWATHDVALTSIGEKLAFFRRELDGTKKFPRSSLKDWNKDGKTDVKDLKEISEKIIRLTDTDGDGVMDSSNVFAEGFNTEVTGIAAGTLAWRGDVYATIAPDLWKLRDTDGDGKADTRESLAHGFGIHIAYAGHDMHGLTLGPDGRVYWSIGDKGTNVTSKEGKNWFAPHEGAVLRCYPDGSGFEIFARGLRNPQEIAFDKYGNLFSVDNDSDQKGERERFLHITEGSDTGWRNYYQYRGSAYNPWMAESIWEPTGEFQPAYITPTNQNYSDGPSGFAYNPGTALNAKYEGAFFVTEFPKGNLRSFKVKPKGATFEMTDEHVVLSGPMNVGINFGPDGALYSADWSGGYPLNEKGAIWKLDDPNEAGSEIRKEVAAMLKAGTKDVSTTDLVNLLSHPDMRIRLDAQWELAGRKAIAELNEVATSWAAPQLARIHAVWALTQIGGYYEKAMHSFCSSDDDELRAQAAKHAGETIKGRNHALTTLLADRSPRVRFHAATAIWKTGDATAIDAVITLLAENDNKDAYLRHAGVLALTASSPEQIAAKTLAHESASVRLAAAVAFRRLSSPLAAKLLADADPKVAAEAAHAIYDDPAIKAAYPSLADLIRTNPKASAPTARRSIAANRYLAGKESAVRLANYAASEDVPQDLRIAALEALASWAKVSRLNPVDGRYDPLDPADAEIAKAAFMPVSAVLSHHPEKGISAAAAAVSKSLGIVADLADLEKTILDPKADPASRIAALDVMLPAKPADHAKLLRGLLEDRSSYEVRIRSAAILAESDPQAVIDYAAAAIMKSEQVGEQQQAILLLGKMKAPAARELLENYSERFAEDGKTRSHLLLEFSEALPDFSAKIPKHSASLAGGDPALGEKVFNEHLAAQCTACHRIGKEGSEVGPPLTEIGRKGREYILESLVDPQAKLTPGYGMMSLTKKDKTTLAGALKEEDAEKLTLILPDKTEATVKLSEIESRTAPMSVMPPMGDILSPRELRDLVAWLAGQQ